VQLSRPGQPPIQEVLSGDDGQYAFSSVAPGPFLLTFTYTGLATQVISGELHPGEAYAVPQEKLAVATQTIEVRVGLTQEEIAEVQVKEQEKQRVLGIVPNFFVTYNPDAVALRPKQKFRLAWKSTTDPFTFIAVGAVAGIEQAGNQWSGYGQGFQGYAKRYGATYADVVAGTFLGGAVFPSLLKQDPRYFYKGTGTTRSRFWYALSRAFVCKGDNGNSQPNYSNILGAFATGAVAYSYYPASNRKGANVIVSTGLIRIGETAIAGVFQEFVVKKLTPNIPTQPADQP
jgi:hypothetical protein